MRVALLGYPMAGKRTLFALLTGRIVPAGHSEPGGIEGIAPVRDPRIDAIARICRPEKKIYAENTFVLCPDILTENDKREWLEPARKCEALCLLVRDFASDSVYHPAGSVNVARDRVNLRTELLLADLELVEKRLERIEKEQRAGETPAQAAEKKALLKCRAALEKDEPLLGLSFDPHEAAALKSLGFMTMKPMLWTHNVDESRLCAEWKRLSAEKSATGLVSCRIEQEIGAVEDPEERRQYQEELGVELPGADRLNKTAYETLGLISFFTMGEDEARAWTIRKGTAAPAAAGKIHKDIEKGFIRVEVIKYDDLLAAGSEKAVKEAGKAMLKGKDYIVEDGDICYFRFGA